MTEGGPRLLHPTGSPSAATPLSAATGWCSAPSSVLVSGDIVDADG